MEIAEENIFEKMLLKPNSTQRHCPSKNLKIYEKEFEQFPEQN